MCNLQHIMNYFLIKVGGDVMFGVAFHPEKYNVQLFLLKSINSLQHQMYL